MNPGAWLVTACALAASLAFNAALFSFLPVMGYLRQHAEGRLLSGARETRLVPLPVMPKKKEKPLSKEPSKAPVKKAPEPGKSVARQRFVMDLGPGGGSGAGGGGAAMAGGDLEQATFSEGETDEDARPISQPAPKPPKKAEAAGVGGLVRCLLTVGEDGRVVEVSFLEVPGNYGFEEAVREAVSAWRYRPATVAGVPVRQKIEQPFKF